MKRTVRTIELTASTVLLAASWSFAQATPGPAVEPQDIQKAVISAQVSSRSTSAPLDMRVSVQYVNGKPADILQVLAKAAGLTVEVSSSDLRPVTLTLTNVRLRTALDAICDTAECTWKLDGTTIKLASTGMPAATGLPPLVSVALEEVAVPDVFRAIGAAVGIGVVIEGRSGRPPMTVKFTKAPTGTVLDWVCKNAGCTWEYDNGSRQLRVRFPAP
jgi:hypothetical protein